MGKRNRGTSPLYGTVVPPSTPAKVIKGSNEAKLCAARAPSVRVTRSRSKSGRLSASHDHLETPYAHSVTGSKMNITHDDEEITAMTPEMTSSGPQSGPELKGGKNDVNGSSIPHLASDQLAPARFPLGHGVSLPDSEAATTVNVEAPLLPPGREGASEVAIDSGPRASGVRSAELDNKAFIASPTSEAKSGGHTYSLAEAIASFDDDPTLWEQAVTMEERRESGAGADVIRPVVQTQPLLFSESQPTGRVSDADLQRKVWVNRAPVLSLWAAVVAQREGYTWPSAITFGRAIAGNFAASKAQRLGIKRGRGLDGEWGEFSVFGTFVDGKQTKDGLCAVHNGLVISVEAADTYLEKAYSVNLLFAKAAMERLASCYLPGDIGLVAYKLYEDFRPDVSDGVKGWGAKGLLDLSKINSVVALAKCNNT